MKIERGYSIFIKNVKCLLSSVEESHKKEFTTYLNKINKARISVTAKTFIALEAIMIIVFFFNKENVLKPPDLYYAIMYLLLIIVMSVYLLVLVKFDKNISKYESGITIFGATFAVFLLSWCAVISLLDQLSYGQINVYAVAIISIAVFPVIHPLVTIFIYLPVQALFVELLPFFQQSSEILFGHYINSTFFIAMAWVISSMRYKNYINDFNNRKLIQEKSAELKRVNVELEEANQKLAWLSQTDGLTGVFNRLAFDRTIKAEWDRCKLYGIALSLIMIDVDYFKMFNDSYGHQAGDECLKWIAQVLSTCAMHSVDTVARYGGEEFALILPHMQKEQAFQIAERLRNGVEKLAIPHINSSVSKYVTISLGVHSLIPSAASDMRDFIKAADEALYEAKKDRNKVCATRQ